jgi:hypothetical protein
MKLGTSSKVGPHSKQKKKTTLQKQLTVNIPHILMEHDVNFS